MKTIRRQLKDTGLMPEGAGILDVTSSGRYWRTSHILSISLIRRQKNETADNEAGGTLTEIIFLYEQESDDYEILPALSGELEGLTRLITFNGHTFDLPYLRRKYTSYALKDPFERLLHTDLYALYRPLVRIFALPSGKLADFYEFSGNDAASLLPDSEGGDFLPSSALSPDSGSPGTEAPLLTDALLTLSICGLGAYLDAFDGKGSFKCGSLTDDHLYLTMTLETPCPHEVSLHDTVFHIRIAGDTLTVGIPVENGAIRIYHTDLANYIYLPYEGYAVHKSVAKYVEKSRTQKVTRETCFHYAKVSPRLADDPDEAIKVLRSVLAYTKTR